MILFDVLNEVSTTNVVFVWHLFVSLLNQRASHPGSVAERWPYLPGPVEDGHEGARPWLSDAVSMMPQNDWLHGCWQSALTARRRKKKAAAPETRRTGSMWNVTGQGCCEGHSENRHASPWCQAGACSQASCCMQTILGLNLSFVWSWLGLCLPLGEQGGSLWTTVFWLEKGNLLRHPLDNYKDGKCRVPPTKKKKINKYGGLQKSQINFKKKLSKNQQKNKYKKNKKNKKTLRTLTQTYLTWYSGASIVFFGV